MPSAACLCQSSVDQTVPCETAPRLLPAGRWEDCQTTYEGVVWSAPGSNAGATAASHLLVNTYTTTTTLRALPAIFSALLAECCSHAGAVVKGSDAWVRTWASIVAGFSTEGGLPGSDQ